MTAGVPVPDESELQLGTVRLPADRLLRWRAEVPVAWITKTPVLEPGPVWSALSALHGETGLIPVVAPARRGDELEDASEDTSAAADVDRVSAAAMLEHRWADCFPERGRPERRGGRTGGRLGCRRKRGRRR